MRVAIGLAMLAVSAQAALGQAANDGRLLASGCFQCHGTNGVNGGFDTLAGQSKKDILEELTEMRGKAARKNMMYPHARGYSRAQLALIADYFARLPKP